MRYYRGYRGITAFPLPCHTLGLTHTQAKLHNNGYSKDRRVSHIHKLSFITMETAKTDGSHSHIHKLSFITMETAKTDGSHSHIQKLSFITMETARTDESHTYTS